MIAPCTYTIDVCDSNAADRNQRNDSAIQTLEFEDECLRTLSQPVVNDGNVPAELHRLLARLNRDGELLGCEVCLWPSTCRERWLEYAYT